MRPVLIDTNAYVAFKQGETSIVEIFQNAEILGISPIVLGELLGGFRNGSKPKKNEEELQSFLYSFRIKLFNISSDTAIFYSQIYASLKVKGRPIPTNDMWIAAQVIENGCVLCTYDKHFEAIDGLVLGTTVAKLFV